MHRFSGPNLGCSAVRSSRAGLLLFFKLLMALLTSVYVKGLRISIGGVSVTALVLSLLKKSSKTLDIFLISLLSQVLFLQHK